MTRISVPLGKAELAALLGMATADCQHPREQMRYLLREEAKRRGLLPADSNRTSEPPLPLAAQPQLVGAQHATAS